jgi:beta-galactosidase
VVESNADTVLNVQVQGGTVLGFGSAQDRTEDKYYQGECHSYYGRALLAVRVDADEMSINVRGKEIKEASLTVKTV